MGNRTHKPGIGQKYLLLMAGIMWLAIGIMLFTMAILWLLPTGQAAWFIIPGVLLALVVHHFGFLKIVDRNLGRIGKMDPRPCAFAFMSWKSYLLVAVMMTLGITLRHSHMPRKYLSVIYITIGLALLLSSIRYIRHFFLAGKKGNDQWPG